MDPLDVVKNILLTEKIKTQEKQNKYLFVVDRRANKIDVKKAVEHLYKVKVQKVNTMVMPGKLRRVRYVAGLTSQWKKAYVTLVPGQKIEVK